METYRPKACGIQEAYRKAAVDAVKKLSQDVGIPTDLKDIVKAEDLDLIFQDEQITIRAKAKEQDLDSLSAANIQVQIDLSGYGEGEYEVPVTVTLPGGYELVESIKVKVKLVPGAEK